MAANYMSEVFYYKSPENESKDGVQEDIDRVIVSSTSAEACCPSCDELRKDLAEMKEKCEVLKERSRKADLFNAAADLISPVYRKMLYAAIDQGLPPYVTLGTLLNPGLEFRKQYLPNTLQALSITTTDFNRIMRIYKPDRHDDFDFEYNTKSTFTERIELLQSSTSSD